MGYLLGRVTDDWSYIFFRLRFEKLDKGEAIPDYIAQHEQYNQVEEVFVAEAMFVLVAHNPRVHPRSESKAYFIRYAIVPIYSHVTSY